MLRSLSQSRLEGMSNSKQSPRGYSAVHRIESMVLAMEPSIGTSDVSDCLPGWIKTFCEKHEAGEGYEISKHAVRSLLHTLIAARARQHRLAAERDALAA